MVTTQGTALDRLTNLAFCAFADVYLSVYPAVVLSKLQMNRRKKIVLSVALGFGSL